MDGTESVRSYFRELVHGRHRTSSCDLAERFAEPILTPNFVERDVFEAARTAATAVSLALETAAERLLVDGALRRMIGIAAYTDELLEIDRERNEPSLVARLDGFIGADGVIRFVENNGFDPRASPAYHRAHAALPIYEELRSRFAVTNILPYDGAADAIRVEQERRGRSPVSTVALVDRGDEPTDNDPCLSVIAKDAGWPVHAVHPSALTYQDGRVWANGTAIDIVVVSEYDIIGEAPDLSELIAAVRDGAVRLPYSISRGILTNHKGAFELLADPDGVQLFDIETQRMLRAHVPWTRAVRERRTTFRDHSIDLLPFISRERERFVLKPCSASSGAGVAVGHLTSDADWQKVLDRSRITPYIVQEAVDLGPARALEYFERGEIKTDTFAAGFDPFVWASYAAGGAYSRVSRSGLHNLSSGAMSAPLVVIERS